MGVELVVVRRGSIPFSYMVKINHELFLSLYQKGIITHKPLLQLEYDNKVKQLLKSGMGKKAAMTKVSKDCGVSFRTIQRACKAVIGFNS